MVFKSAEKIVSRTTVFALLLGLVVGLGGCGGGGGGGDDDGGDGFGGWPVDGPALSLPIEGFAVDLNEANGQATDSLADAVSDDTTGALELSLPEESAPVIVVGTADAETTDLSTGAAPYFVSMRTAITQQMETDNADTPISFQMNPMTTLAVMIAIANADPAAADHAVEFEARLATAADQVMSTFGFGMMAADYDLFTSPTVIEPEMTTDQQQAAAFYRARLLHVNAIVKALVDGGAGATPGEVLAEMAADLNDDATLNGSVATHYDAAAMAAALAQSTATIPVPDSTSGQTPDDVVAILTAEAAITAPDDAVDFTGFDPALNVSATPDNDGDSTTNNRDPLPDNAAPVAVDDSYAVNEAGTYSPGAGAGVVSNDTDTDAGDVLTTVLGTNVTNGTLTLNPDGSFDYTHDGSETTSDSFTYKVNDGAEDSNTATVSITINPVNDAPVAVADTYPTSEGGVLNTTAAQGVLVTNDTDAEGDALTAVLDTDVVNGSLTLNADGSFDYTHDGSETTQDTFTYHANDGTDDSAVVTVTINVTPVNDPPVVVDDTYGPVAEGAVLNVNTATGVLVSNDTDAEGDTLSAVVVTPPTHGALTLNTDGSFSYTHNGDHVATDSFTYKANDGAADSATTATVTINVTLVDDAPVAVDDGYGLSGPGASINMDAAGGVLFNDSDEEGDNMTANLVTGPTHSSAFNLNADGSFTYTHDDGATTVDTFTYNVTANGKTSNTATVTIAVNQPPGVVADTYAVDEGGNLNLDAAAGVESNDPADADGDPTTVVLGAGPAHASAFTLNADGSFDYTHDGGEDTTDSFTYRRNDGSQNGPLGTVTINITGINDAPVAVADTYGPVNEGSTLTLTTRNTGVLGNDSDADDPTTFTAVLVQDVTNGTLTLNPDGSFVYVHDGSETTSDSFTYKPNDGAADGNTVTVDISVTAVNDAPTAVNDPSVTPLSTAINIALPIDVLANDSDAEDGAGSNLTIVSVQSATNGAGKSEANQAVTITGGGKGVTYTPANDYFGTDTFTYTVKDADGAQATATVTVTVNAFPVNTSGVYKTTFSATAATGSECGFGVGDNFVLFVGINQVANTMTVYLHMGDKMTGTITDNNVASYPINIADALNETSFAGAFDSGNNTLSGTLTIAEPGECDGTLDIASSSMVRGPVADVTKLGGLYGVELRNVDDHSMRTVNQIQVDVSAGGTAEIHVPGGMLTVTEFDPVSGFFHGSLFEGVNGDADLTGNGINDTWTRQGYYAGILVTDSTSDNCLASACTTPAIVLSQEYEYARQLGSRPAVDDYRDYDGYGRRIEPQAWNSIFVKESGDQFDSVGLFNVPLDLADAAATLDQSIDVHDSAGSICTQGLRSQLRILQNVPRPAFDFNQPLFQDHYSNISCNAALGTLGGGEAVTVNLADGGVSQAFNTTAVLGAVPASGPARANASANGAVPSQTMVGGTIPLFGYFNNNGSLAFSNPLPTGVATPDAVQLVARQDSFWRTVFGYRDEWRVEADSGVDPSFTVPAGTFGDNGIVMRMWTRYADNGGDQLFGTDWLYLTHGFSGAVQSEFDSSSPFITADLSLTFAKFQVQMRSDPLGLGQIYNCTRVNDVPALQSEFDCDPANSTPFATVDFDSDLVTVNMVDNFGDYAGANGPFTLELGFADSATVTPRLMGGSPSTVSGVGQVVNPELKIVSRYWSNANSDHATVASLGNPFYEHFSSGILYDSSDAMVATVWDDATARTGASNYGAPFNIPLDGVSAQTIGGYQDVSSRVNDAGDTRLPADTYQLRLTPAVGGNYPAVTFENTYTREDAAPLDPPFGGDITVNATALASVLGRASAPENAVHVGSDPFTLSWVSTAPADTQWKVILQVWETGDGTEAGSNPNTDPLEAQIATGRLTSADAALTHDAGTSTWTWENNDPASLFGSTVALPEGFHAKVLIRAIDPATTMPEQVINADSDVFWLKNSTVPSTVTTNVNWTSIDNPAEDPAKITSVDVTLGVPTTLPLVACGLYNTGQTGGVNVTQFGAAWAFQADPFAGLTAWEQYFSAPLAFGRCLFTIPVGSKVPVPGDFQITVNGSSYLPVSAEADVENNDFSKEVSNALDATNFAVTVQ